MIEHIALAVHDDAAAVGDDVICAQIVERLAHPIMCPSACDGKADLVAFQLADRLCAALRDAVALQVIQRAVHIENNQFQLHVVTSFANIISEITGKKRASSGNCADHDDGCHTKNQKITMFFSASASG